MSRSTKALCVAGLVMALAVAGAPPALAGVRSKDEAPTATEVGVTADEIRIAVVADVDNPIRPGIFQPAVDGAKGAVSVINKQGGIAGRKVVIDFIDSHLNPTETRNALIQACQNDFAMVGTTAVFVTNFDDVTNCKDQKGQVTGLPDFAGFAAGQVQACAPTSFPVLPPQVVCSTKDQHPQTYRSYSGAAQYLVKKHGDLHGAFVASNDTPDGFHASQVLGFAVQDAGIKADQDVGVSARAPQSVYTPIIAKMKQDNSNFGYGGAQPISFRQEAVLQGLGSDVVWLCGTVCYTSDFANAGADTEGEYVSLPFLPFEDAGKNKAMTTFVHAVGKDKIQSYSIYSYSAVLAFKAAIDAAVKEGGINNITRAAALKGVKSLTAFNAGGLFGTEDIAAKEPSACFVLVQLEGGTWKRVTPTKPGTFDCKPSNAVTLKHDFG